MTEKEYYDNLEEVDKDINELIAEGKVLCWWDPDIGEERLWVAKDLDDMLEFVRNRYKKLVTLDTK